MKKYKPKARDIINDKSSSRRSRPINEEYTELNKHINFNREIEKTNARKVLTEVKCCACNVIFTLPFRPRHPEVYCDNCFKKHKNKK